MLPINRTIIDDIRKNCNRGATKKTLKRTLNMHKRDLFPFHINDATYFRQREKPKAKFNCHRLISMCHKSFVTYISMPIIPLHPQRNLAISFYRIN
jgi:hypothetical protein